MVYEDSNEVTNVVEKLTSKGYNVETTNSLTDALETTRDFLPDLIVLNTTNPIGDVELFNTNIEKRYSKKIDLLNLLDLENYLKVRINEHVAIKPVNPDLLFHLVHLIIKN